MPSAVNSCRFVCPFRPMWLNFCSSSSRVSLFRAFRAVSGARFKTNKAPLSVRSNAPSLIVAPRTKSGIRHHRHSDAITIPGSK